MIMIPNPSDDIVNRLKFWSEMPKGTSLPPDTDNGWDDLIRDVCSAAIAEIEELRARVATLVIFTGAATSGPDLREIKDGQARDAMR